MKPIFFSFRADVPAASRAAALDRIRSHPAVEAAGELFPGATHGKAAGAMVATVGDRFEAGDFVAELRRMNEVEEVSEAAERELV